MDDRRDDRNNCEPNRDGERNGGPSQPNGGGGDTRFLQLEMSQVLYSEAEGVARQAFRELLVEDAKARFRERFGEQINALAQLAVDELLREVFDSLDVEQRIRDHNERSGEARERVREIFAASGRATENSDYDEPQARQAAQRRGKRKR